MIYKLYYSCAIAIRTGGVILAQLLEWLRWHFVEGDKMAREALESDRPCDHPAYWDAVSALYLLFIHG